MGLAFMQDAVVQMLGKEGTGSTLDQLLEPEALFAIASAAGTVGKMRLYPADRIPGKGSIKQQVDQVSIFGTSHG